jgi:alkylation response protein AidB-like acyl-CoA dehydrogenase
MEQFDKDQLDAFRSRVKSWLADNAATNGWVLTPESSVSGRGADGEFERAKVCQRMLFDSGFAGISWPTEYGGQGMGIREQVVFNDEARHYDLPLSPFIIGLGMCGPTLLALGTQEQKSRYLPAMLAGEEVWCQLFSEPGAGSDVAALTTRATRDGAGWLISGQKIWTSGTHYCDYGILLARTDFDAPKHQGITMFVVDMRAQGLTIRPIHQMDGGSRFNEVYFDNVRVPAEAVVGEVGGGWKAATTTLANERVSLGAVRTLDDVPSAVELIETARRKGLADHKQIRQQLVDVWTREKILATLGERVTAAILNGETPGPAGSLSKLSRTEYTRRAARLAAQLDGANAIAWADGVPASTSSLLYVPCLSIAGGTDEVLRNIIGERVLGLPREPSADRGKPFREMTRSAK